MDSSLKKLYIDTYRPLLADFAEQVRNSAYSGIPEPFLPLYGEMYEATPTRIAFVGMETRGWGNMAEFILGAIDNPEETLVRNFEEFEEMEFRFWGNNFGSSFWDFNFKFLAAFHNIPNWKEVKTGKHEDILKSFAWGNTNSIERYHITAQKRGVPYPDWVTVKNASSAFDNAKHILTTLQPQIMVVLCWSTEEDWLTDDLGVEAERQQIDDHFLYYFLPATQTHVLWTAHPMWLAKNRDFDAYIKYLVAFVKQKMEQTARK